MNDHNCIGKAIDIAVKYGGVDVDHHKAWVIDQMVRALPTAEGYKKVIADECSAVRASKKIGW